jgi:hypothetical protein
VFRFLALAIAAIFGPRVLLVAENLCLRQQLLMLQRRHPRPRLGDADQCFWSLRAGGLWQLSVCCGRSKSAIRSKGLRRKNLPRLEMPTRSAQMTAILLRASVTETVGPPESSRWARAPCTHASAQVRRISWHHSSGRVVDKLLASISEGASQSWCSPAGESPARVRPSEPPGSKCCCVKKTRKRHAVREMKEGPSEPPCRRRLQTATSCFGQKPRWCCVKKARKRHAVREMKEDPSEPPCRRRLQTAMSCFGQKPR